MVLHYESPEILPVMALSIFEKFPLQLQVNQIPSSFEYFWTMTYLNGHQDPSLCSIAHAGNNVHYYVMFLPPIDVTKYLTCIVYGILIVITYHVENLMLTKIHYALA